MSRKIAERYVKVTMRHAVLARAIGMHGEQLIAEATYCRFEQGDVQADGKVFARLIPKGEHVPSEEDIRTLFPGLILVEYVGCTRPAFYESRVAPRVEIGFRGLKDTTPVIPQELVKECARIGWEARVDHSPQVGNIVLLVPQRYGFVDEAPRRAVIVDAYLGIGLEVTTFYKECGLESAFS
ncbi:hypothetical protein HY624_02150 [Candidatus Uhrbacteria bacterium]|nr:hypothetical protein [Candidatus Uhrbacteria bacterium]